MKELRLPPLKKSPTTRFWRMDWNQRYLDQDIPWDKDGASPVLQELLRDLPDALPAQGHALVPGCGLGHDAYLLASQGYHCRGIDLSQKALDLAQQRYQHPRLSWQQGDLFRELPEEAVDLIWEYTCYCAIQPLKRAAYVQAMHQTLRPEGILVGIFLLDSGMPPEEGPPFSSPLEELHTEFENHFELVWERWPPHSSPGWERRERLMCWRKKP